MSDLITSFGGYSSILLVLTGAVLVVTGAVLRRERGTRPRTREIELKLVVWHVAPADGAADVERQIRAYYRSITATSWILVGLLVALAGMGLGLLVVSGHGVSDNAAAPWFQWLLALAFVVGTGLAYPLAVWLAHRTVSRGPRYADLRPRRLADYRAPALRLPALVAIGAQVATAVVLIVLYGVWTMLFVPLLATFAFGVAELEMWSTARVPRMVVTADPATARRCDDLVRAGVISRLQFVALAAVGLASAIGMSFVTGAAGQIARPGFRPALLTCFLTTLCCFAGAGGLALLQERMGGRVTGWRWRPVPDGGERR